MPGGRMGGGGFGGGARGGGGGGYGGGARGGGGGVYGGGARGGGGGRGGGWRGHTPRASRWGPVGRPSGAGPRRGAAGSARALRTSRAVLRSARLQRQAVAQARARAQVQVRVIAGRRSRARQGRQVARSILRARGDRRLRLPPLARRACGGARRSDPPSWRARFRRYQWPG